MRGTTPLGDEAVVEIVLRLIDDERRFGLEQQQEQDRGGLLAGGEALERLPRRGLPGGSRIESDRGRRGQVEFLDAHQHLGLSLGEALALGWRDAERLVQRRRAGTAGLDELSEGEIANATEAVDRFGQSPANLLPEEVAQRLAIAGRGHLYLHSIAELLVDSLRRAVQASELLRLEVLPLRQQAAAAVGVLLLGAPG